MSRYVPGGTGGEGSVFTGTTGARKFYATGGQGQSAAGNVYTPTPSGGGSGQPGGGSEDIPTPGVISINPLDPVGSAQAAADPISGFFDGLKNGLFGTSLEDTEGKHGGLLGDVPGLGAGLRAGSEAIANVGGAVGGTLSGASDVVGGALERIPNGANPITGFNPDGSPRTLTDEYNSLPDEFRKEWEASGRGGDNGIFGTGLFSNKDHAMATAIRQFQEEQQVKNPTLFGGKFTPAPSLADSINGLFDVFGAGADLVQRGVAGWDKANGMNQLDMVKAVGRGEAAWDTFGSKNTPIEQLAYEKTANGEWTDDQALDWLASHGAGYSHDVRLQIAGSVGLDPLNVATFGAGAIAKTGLKGAQIVADVAKTERFASEAATALKAAEEAVDAAKVGRYAGQAAKVREAEAAVVAAQKDVTTAKHALDVAKEYHATGSVSKLNPLAKAVEGSEHVQDLLKLVGKTYNGLEGTYIGRAAKITRTIIDPLHDIDLHMPGNARSVDLMSDSLTRTLADTMGGQHYLGAFENVRALDATGGIADQMARDLGTAMTNRGREGILSLHQASAVDRGLAGELATFGMDTERGVIGAQEDVIAQAAKSMKEKDLLGWLRQDIVQNVLKHNWGEAEHMDLGRSLSAAYGLRSAEDWAKVLAGLSKEQKSLYALAVYGRQNSRLLHGISSAKAAGHAALETVNMDRMVLLSKKTLTRVGADSLLAQLSKPRLTTKKALAIIADWQERYPELRYIAMDPANPGKSVKQMVRYLEDHAESFPMQLKDEELSALPDDLKEVADLTGGEYQFGFRPRDEFLWGIERANEAGGKYIAKTVPWADHVGEGGLGYRPGIELPRNIAGMPIVGAAAKKGARALDYVGIGGRTLKSQVTGAQIHEVARQRFISEASRGKLAEHGLTEGLASKWWDRLQEYTREHQGYSGPRGFGKGDLFGAIEKDGLIPQTMLNGANRLQAQDVLRMVLEAYDGDIRYIGLTQKLSGRAKVIASRATGYNSNFAGEIAEHAWPLLKFRYNPIFQLQEKVEPWVLNAQRGITPQFLKPTLSEADAATERLLQRMTDNSLIRQADLDQAEYSSQVLFGRQWKTIAAEPTSRLQSLAKNAGALMDVQGVKRINMLRTFRKGLGKELQRAWEEARPGEWQQMLDDAIARSGKHIDEDEFAVQMMGEQLFANDIVVNSLTDGLGRNVLHADWENAIKPGEWYRPTHIGEVKALDLDHVAKGMVGFEDGTKVKNLGDLRRALAEDPKRLDEVTSFLNRLGADKDYVSRVENALTFSWTGFWKEAERRYSLTFEESTRLQNIIAASAEVRGMDPVDFFSQVFDPGIIDGNEGLLGSLDKPLGVLRKNAAGETVGRGRSKLAGVAGTSTHEDLVHQLAGVFAQHLDPSAKRALLMEFKPEVMRDVRSGKLRLSKDDLKALWDADAEGQLADRILGYMDGAPPAGKYDVLKDEARGIKTVRDGANKYLRDHGVTPQSERAHVQVDDAHYERVAGEYRDLPEVPYEKTGRRPTTKQVYAADRDLKPQPAGVDDRTYQAYQQFVHETADQFEFMTKPKSKGGMGIEVIVAKGDPYTADAAGRAAMQKDIRAGRIRVLGQSSDHPLMTNEQNVMFRAVHDVFGHGAEDFAFGPRGELNAAANHFKMYGPEARGPLLTETHGQTAYVNYSDDVIPGEAPRTPLDETDPALDFEARHPLEPDRLGAPGDPDAPAADYRTVTLSGDKGTTLDYTYTQTVGAGLKALSPELQAHLLQPLEDLMQEFPDLRVHHVDVVDFEAPLESLDDDMLVGLDTHTSPFAVTFGADADGSVILFNKKFAESADYQEDWQMLHRHNETMRQYDTFYKKDAKTGKFEDKPRESAFGSPHNAVGPEEQFTLQQVMRHEAGHAFDVARRPRIKQTGSNGQTRWVRRPVAGQEQYADMMARFEKEAGRLHLSEYGMKSGEEFAAELFAFTTNPALDMDKVMAYSPDLHAMVTEFRDYLTKVGEWKPAVASPNAGRTVREVNAAKRGTVYAPQKAGLLPQSTIDEFATQFVGKGKHVESNPDVARTAQYFGAWSQKVLKGGLLDGDNAIHADLISRVAGIPTDAAVPYNLTEGLAHQAATAKMVEKWQDAYRLQYFAQSRSMFERSINHPMFGLYPASYMWGKIMPEVVQFIAQRPFGLKTGGGLYTAMDLQANVAMQREFNPEFDAAIEKLGHSQALSFAGYLMPTLPWDISASAPTWMKDIAGQGLRSEQNVEEGGQAEDFNAVQPAVDVVSKLNPLETTIPWAGRAIDEANGANTPKEQLAATLAEDEGYVTATDLEGPMALIMAELQAELSK